MMKELKKGQQGKGLHTYILNGLMAFPNLIALILLSPIVFKLSKEYCVEEDETNPERA